MSQKRAKIGGEIGLNGEHYNAGAFICTTEHGKGKPRKRTARKVQVEPYVWVIDDRTPLLNIVGTGAGYIDRNDWTKGIEPYMPAFRNGVMYNGETLANVQAMCDRFNAGERWM